MVAVTLTGGCIEHRVAVTGSQLHRGLWAMRTQGQAEVMVIHQLGERPPTAEVEVIRADQVLTVGRERLTPLALGQGCLDLPPAEPDAPVDPRCRLSELRDFDFDIRTSLQADRRRIGNYAAGGLALGFVGAVIGCEIGCADDSGAKLASDIVVGGAAALVVGAMAWGLVMCVTGEISCRD